LLWNEKELELNEQIKATLSAEKIDEPKTPYIRDFSPEKVSSTETSSEGHSRRHKQLVYFIESEGDEGNGGWESSTTASSGCDDFEVRRFLHYQHDGLALRDKDTSGSDNE
jgi:protein phosphatase inhibitor 2 IPP2